MTAEPILYFSAEKRACAVNIGLLQHFLRGHFVAAPFWGILNFGLANPFWEITPLTQYSDWVTAHQTFEIFEPLTEEGD